MTTAKRRLIEEAERVNPVVPVHIWRSPAGSAVELLVVTHLEVYTTIHQHASDALPNETGGFLIGRVAHDERDGCWHLEIEEALPMEPSSQNPLHFTFTWRDVDRVRSYREEQGKALIGWYHTHPDLGIFLSETDLERTHRVLFSEPFQIALVYDPVRRRAGYFFWEGAQTIDAAAAPWREFDIAVASEEAAGGLEEHPSEVPPVPAAADSAPAIPSDASPAAPAAVAAPTVPTPEAAVPVLPTATGETLARRPDVGAAMAASPKSDRRNAIVPLAVDQAQGGVPVVIPQPSAWPKIVLLLLIMLLAGLVLGYAIFSPGVA